MNFEESSQSIIRQLSKELPLVASMFQKNLRRYKAVVDCFIVHVRPLKSQSILDYGCGHPLIAKILTDMGFHVTAFEPYAEESNELKTAELLGLSGSFCVKLGEKVQFDHVLMVDVIEHLAIISPVMEEVHGLIAPGGSLTVSTPNVMRLDMWIAFVSRSTGHPQPLATYLKSRDYFTHHQREFTLSELDATLRHFGLIPMYSTSVDTRPKKTDLAKYHHLQGKVVNTDKSSLFRQLKHVLSELMIRCFPRRFSNNLLMTAKKEK